MLSLTEFLYGLWSLGGGGEDIITYNPAQAGARTRTIAVRCEWTNHYATHVTHVTPGYLREGTFSFFPEI